MKHAYTMDDLKEIDRLYAENFESLVKSINTKTHQYYLDREIELESRYIEAQKSLGIWIPDPCQLELSIPCEKCTPKHRKGFICKFKKVSDAMCRRDWL